MVYIAVYLIVYITVYLNVDIIVYLIVYITVYLIVYITVYFQYFHAVKVYFALPRCVLPMRLLIHYKTCNEKIAVQNQLIGSKYPVPIKPYTFTYYL